MKFSQYYPPLLDFLKQPVGSLVLYPLPENETTSKIMAQITARTHKTGTKVEQKLMFLIDPKSGQSSKVIQLRIVENNPQYSLTNKPA
jgi:hypothetical protein